jgi:FG-GAP repeat
MQRRGRVLAVTGAAAIAAAGIASALPGAGTAWDQPVQLQQANVRVRGAAEDDRLGWSVAGVGDVNGDRRLDVAVGAPFSANNERASSGSAHVLYGPFASAADLDVGAPGVRGFRIDGAAEGDFASGSIAAADVNGDRRSDLLIGSPETDNLEREQSGSVYVVFGGARSGQLDLATLTAGFRIDGAETGDQTGWSVGRAGDVNGDGRADMVVGAPLADSNDRIESGSAFVVLGKGSADGIDLSFSPSVRLRLDGADTRERAGWSVAGAGDVNGDKRPDVVVGAPWANPNGRFFAGSAYVVFGQAASTTIDLAAPGGSGFRIDGPTDGDIVFGGVGWSVSGAGDVNGDGRADVIVGFPFYDAGQREDSGAAFVVFGKETPAPVDLASLGNRGFRIDGARAGDLAGASVAALGDVNFDGRADLLVGAEQADNNGREDSGSVYIVYGKKDARAVDLRALGSAGARMDGEVADDLAGWSVAPAGDVNGDKRPDVLVGAHASDGNGRNQSGAAYLLFAPDQRPPRLAVKARSPQRVLAQKGVTLRASCDESCSMRATGAISVAKPRVRLPLLAAEARLSRAGQKVLKLALSTPARARLAEVLKGSRQVQATVTLRALDVDRNTSIATAKVVVRR